MSDAITIDGSQGEGGGQMLRTSLALSLATGRPLRMEKIRAGRRKGGLLRQHLTCVEAAKRIGAARVEGAELRSETLWFRPSALLGGHYHLRVGTAGSTSLVIQAVLPALLLADGPSELIVEGGTHAAFAPSFDYLKLAYAPMLVRMGAEIDMTIDRHGFYPAGGGRIQVNVKPVKRWRALKLLERGKRTGLSARALVSKLSLEIADRELKVVRRELGWHARDTEARDVKGSPGPGNSVVLAVTHEHVTEVFENHGTAGTKAERVAKVACRNARRWMTAEAPVGVHLADQLMLPMVLGAGGSYRTTGLTPHSRTNIGVIGQFLGPRIQVDDADDDAGTLVQIAGLSV